MQVAHFLEADLRPWAAGLAAALFPPDTEQQSTFLPQRKSRRLASRGVSEAPARSGSASAAAAAVSSAARREAAWRCLEELRPLHGAVRAVLRASEVPLLEQLPRTPAGWQPALVRCLVFGGALTLWYHEATACCDVLRALRGVVRSLTLRMTDTCQDANEADLPEAGEPRVCTAVTALPQLRTIALIQDEDMVESFPVWPLLLALSRLTRLAELELHWHEEDDGDAVLGPPPCLPTTLTRLDLVLSLIHI